MTESIKVRVFLPVGVCSCSYVGFLGRIYEAIRKYSKFIDYSEDMANSKMAKQLGIRSRGVLVGSRVLGANITTEQVEEAIRAELETAGIKV